MVYFIVSAVCGIIGGIFSSQVAKDYSLGLIGNIFAGFLGGVATHSVVLASLGGTAFSVAIVGGFIGGVLVRVAFAIIQQRMAK